MSRYQYDLTIIGGGGAGLPAAQVAAELGARTLLIDKERLGGDCLYVGCVPSKALLHAAHMVTQAQQSAQFGVGNSGYEPDLAKIQTYIEDVINEVYAAEASYVEGVDVRFGKVRLISPHELDLNGGRITTRSVLISTGSSPAAPPIPGLAETGYLTNEDVFDLTNLPQSIVIIGGGAIGAELGQALHRLGCQVTILEALPWLLPTEDAEACEEITNALSEEGIRVEVNTRVQHVYAENGYKCVEADTAGEIRTFMAEAVLVATGRRPNVEGLNLEGVGVVVAKDGIVVNDWLQTSVSNIYGAGDVIGGYHLTHVGAMEAVVAVQNALLRYVQKANYDNIPWVTYTDPKVARVGLTEQQAREKYSRVRVVKFPWEEIDRAQIDSVPRGFIKYVLAGRREKLVGAHLVGHISGELLPELVLTMDQGKGVFKIASSPHAYPTLSTGLQLTAWKAVRTSWYWALLKRAVAPILRLLG